MDQQEAILKTINLVQEKTLKQTCCITAARGRGKSAALGLTVSAAVYSGYSNIFLSAPHIENTKALFEFILIGLQALNYKEHCDFEVLQGTEEELKNHIIRINIYKQHRQTIQFIKPKDHYTLV